MKVLLLLIICFSIVLSFVGCQGQSGQPPVPTKGKIVEDN